MNKFELKPTDKKDHYRFFINGVDVTGEQERSTFDISYKLWIMVLLQDYNYAI